MFRKENAFADATLALLYLAQAIGDEGDLDRAEQCFDEAGELIEEHGIIRLKPRYIVYRLHYLRRKLPNEEVVKQLSAAVSLSEELNDRRFATVARASLGDVSFLADKFDVAEDHYQRAARGYGEISYLAAVPLAQFSLALTRWMRGDLKSAQQGLFEIADRRGAANALFAKAALAGLYADTGEVALSGRLFAE